jgi:hypothetical protein
MEELIWKNPKEKKRLHCSSREDLPSKHKALSSNPSIVKNFF